MADDLNRLLIKIQADTSQLSSALQAAQNGVATASAGIERRLSQNASKFASWQKGINDGLGKIVSGYAAYALASKALEAVNTVADLKDLTAASGLSSDQFQELAFAASKSGASLDDLSRSLNKFSINVSQTRLNTGQFNQFLNQQAPALQKALAATQTQAEAVNVLADFMAGLGDDSQRATLLQQAFGKSSADLIDLLSQGSTALKENADRAHELGVVLDSDLIEKADATKKQFAALEAQVTTTFQRMAVASASWLTQVSADLSSYVDQLKKDHPWIASLFGGLALGGADQTGGAFGGAGAGTLPAGVSLPGQTPGPYNMLGGLSSIAGNLHFPPNVPKTSLRGAPDNTGRNALAGLNQQFDESNGDIQQALQDQYDQELKQWQDMLDKKQISEQQFAEARTQLGIIMLNKQKDNLGAETELQKQYYTQTQQLIDSTFMDAFSNALETGKFKASEFFGSLLTGFAKITTEVLVLKPLLNSLFTGVNGSGGISSALNGILGSLGVPARAAGGPGNSGQSYLVGEHGPEIFTPSANGSFGGSGIYARGNGSGGNVYQIDARGADVGVSDRLTKLFSRPQPSPVLAVRQASKRFPNRS